MKLESGQIDVLGVSGVGLSRDWRVVSERSVSGVR